MTSDTVPARGRTVDARSKVPPAHGAPSRWGTCAGANTVFQADSASLAKVASRQAASRGRTAAAPTNQRRTPTGSGTSVAPWATACSSSGRFTGAKVGSTISVPPKSACSRASPDAAVSASARR